MCRFTYKSKCAQICVKLPVDCFHIFHDEPGQNGKKCQITFLEYRKKIQREKKKKRKVTKIE